MSETTLDTMLVRLLGDTSSYIQSMQRASAQTLSTTAVIERGFKTVSSIAARSGMELRTYGNWINGLARSTMSYAGVIASMAGLGSIVAGLNLGVKLAADAEQAQIQFGVMLHSEEKAAKLMSQIERYAAETPLQTAGLQQAAKTLLQFGQAGDNIMPLLKAIGNATGGDNERFQRMSLAFGQMGAAGRLMGQDLLQMINAGFNPLQEIAKMTGKSMAQLKHEMENGAISANMVAKAFEAASAKGGTFEGLMDKQSKSLRGLWSTLTDDIQIQLKRLATFIIESVDLKSLIVKLDKFVQDSQKTLEDWAKYFINQGKSIYNYLAPMFMKTFKIIYSLVSMAVGYWNRLSTSFKSSLIILSLVVAVLGPIIALVASLGAWIPIVTAGLVVGLAALMEYFGGIGPVFSAIVEAATAVYDYLLPIVKQFVDTSIALWNSLYDAVLAIAAGVSAAVGAVAKILAKVFGAATTSSINLAKTIQDSLVMGLLVVEYALLNMGKVGELVFVGLLSSAATLGAEIQDLFVRRIPTYLLNFYRQVQNMLVNHAYNSGVIWGNIAKNVASNMQMLWNYISSGGKTSMKFAWKPLEDGLRDLFLELPALADRELNPLEIHLRKRFGRLATTMFMDFNEFVKKKNMPVLPDNLVKLPEEATKDLEKDAFKLGLGAGESLAKGIHHGNEHVKSAILGSASYFDTVYEYLKGKQRKLTDADFMGFNATKRKRRDKDAVDANLPFPGFKPLPANETPAQQKAREKREAVEAKKKKLKDDKEAKRIDIQEKKWKKTVQEENKRKFQKENVPAKDNVFEEDFFKDNVPQPIQPPAFVEDNSDSEDELKRSQESVKKSKQSEPERKLTAEERAEQMTEPGIYGNTEAKVIVKTLQSIDKTLKNKEETVLEAAGL